MKISVIIPIFNRADFIERSLKSVLDQSYSDLEVIVVDDGSTDETFQVVKKFFSDKRLKYIYQENSGVSSARNLGVSVASFKWIAFLDSDDEWHTNKLLEQVEYHKCNPEYQLIHTEETWIRNGKRVNQPKHYRKKGGEIFLECLSLCAISPSTVLMNKSLFNEMGGFSTSYTVCEDFDLWLKITSKYPVGLVDMSLINKYAGHDDQLSTKYIAMDLYRVRALNNILNIRDLTAREQDEVQKVIVKKCEILIKGYRKHNNLGHIEEVEDLVRRFKS